MSLPTDPNPCYHPKDGGSGSQKVGDEILSHSEPMLPKACEGVVSSENTSRQIYLKVKIDGTDTKR